MKNKEIMKNGMFIENPIFVSFLGMCPTLATTTSLQNAVGMALATIVVLIASNVIISLIKNIIPAEIRIPVYVIIIATLVKSIELLLAAYVPSVYTSLGIFLPLIVVNCIVLGRAEAFASKNNVGKSFFDGLATGLGFLLALALLGTLREVLGTGAINFTNFLDPTVTWIDITLFNSKYAWGLISNPKGAFLTLGTVAGIIGAIKYKRQDRIAAANKLVGKGV